jgi:hypothetical protein
MAKATAKVTANSTTKAMAKGMAEAKIDSRAAMIRQSIDGGLLIIIWSAGLGGAGEECFI